MCLPQLYSNMTLYSYDTIRYKGDDGRPEGCGSASPFSMGLNALVTRNVSQLVRRLALQGIWKEHDLKEFSQVGRVPDDAMMLNIAVRAAVDRCTGLESFRWDLNTKLLGNVYAGLEQLHHLKELWIRFPSGRSPRPTIVIPGMPHLESFTFTHFDPLSYPDDLSTLIACSKNLSAMKMHFSPRMRDTGEPTVDLLTLMRKCITDNVVLKLKTVAIHNLFARAAPELLHLFQHDIAESWTMVNCFGTDEEDGVAQAGSMHALLDSTWNRPPKGLRSIKSMRHDKLSKEFVKLLGNLLGLEKLYLINPRHVPMLGNGFGHQQPSPISSASSTTPTGSEGRTTPTRALPNLRLRDEFLDTIVNIHGPTLKHLILPDRWPLPSNILARLFCACPNLIQLALALELTSFANVRMLLPFLKKIWAVRLLIATTGKEIEDRRFETLVGMSDEVHEQHISQQLASDDFPHLRYVGLGWKAWEIGGKYEEVVLNEDGSHEVVTRRRVKKADMNVIKEVEIWKMDTLDVI